MEDTTFAEIEASLARIRATSEVVVYMNLLCKWINAIRWCITKEH